MLLKKGLLSTIFLLVCFYAFPAIQYYESVLNSGNVTAITPTSLISWGVVDIDFILLNEIPANQDGKIEFRIEPTTYVEVSLTKANDLDARFGFIFKTNNHFTIQIDGLEKNLGFLGYTALDQFRVIKCDLFIYYYKNDDLLYQHCIANPADEFVHTTHVTTAVNTILELTFDSDLGDCSSLVMFAGSNNPEMMMMADGTNADVLANDKKATSENLIPKDADNEKTFPVNKVIVASVFDQAGLPVKQFRIRTTSTGTIPETHAVYDYMKESYRIKFKEQ